MSIDTAITGFLYWLAAGSFIWMIKDPTAQTEQFERWWIWTRGRLPRRSTIVFFHAGTIVFAPLMLVGSFIKRHNKVYGR